MGNRTRPLIYPPSATAPCWHAFGGGRVFWPQVRHASPTAAHPSPPPPPGQHARVIGRVRVIPPDAAPSSMRLLVALIYAVYQCTSSSCSVPRNTPLAGPPQATRVRRPARTAHSCHALPSGAAASARSELRRALHTARARPPRDTRTPHLRRRAHPFRTHALLPTKKLTPKLRAGRVRGRRDSGAGSKGGARCVGAKSPSAHTSICGRAPTPFPARDNPASLTTAAPHARPSPHRRRSHPPCPTSNLCQPVLHPRPPPRVVPPPFQE